jgi:hypothetical protein
MRVTRLLPCLALIACGDNNGAGPSDAHKPDSPHEIDAPEIDAPVKHDAISGNGSRIWAVGDFITDGTNIGGIFSDGD